MPFNFIDVEAKKNKNIIFLFITLVLFYFAGALLIYTAFYAEAFIRTSRFSVASIFAPDKILIIFGVSFIVALLHWLLTTVNMIPGILKVLRAHHLDPEDRYHQMYRNIIEEVSVAAGGRHIEPYVINSHFLNAFAVTDFKDRSIIGITEGLLVKMKRRQVEAVVAHEASHIIWNDSLLTTIGCSITSVFEALYRMMISSRRGSNRRGAGIGGIFVFLVVALMRFLTLLLNMWISREREFRADATAVRMTRDPLSLAEALYRIKHSWRGSHTTAAQLEQIFIVSPAHSGLAEKKGFFADLFATHPPVKERLNILLSMAHADIEALRHSEKKPPPVEEDIVISAPQEKAEWFAHHNGIWEGPFALSQLGGFDWFKPASWIKKDGIGQVKPAYEYSEINKLFRSKKMVNAGNMDCSACRHPLTKIYYEGVTIHTCQYCRGSLVEKEKLPRILAREEKTFSDEIKKMAKVIMSSPPIKGYRPRNVISRLSCPRCSHAMIKNPYPPLYPRYLEIDECIKCNLIWFDRHELEVVQYLQEHLT